MMSFDDIIQVHGSSYAKSKLIPQSSTIDTLPILLKPVFFSLSYTYIYTHKILTNTTSKGNALATKMIKQGFCFAEMYKSGDVTSSILLFHPFLTGITYVISSTLSTGQLFNTHLKGHRGMTGQRHMYTMVQISWNQMLCVHVPVSPLTVST